MKYNVILVNRDLSSGAPPRLVQTYLGLSLGQSRYDGTWNSHILVIDGDTYEKHAKDLFRCAHMAMRKWEPHFVAVKEDVLPLSVAPPATAKPPVQAATADMAPLPDTAESLSELKYFALLGVAKRLGIETKGIEKSDIIAAILEKNLTPA